MFLNVLEAFQLKFGGFLSVDSGCAWLITLERVWREESGGGVGLSGGRRSRLRRKLQESRRRRSFCSIFRPIPTASDDSEYVYTMLGVCMSDLEALVRFRTLQHRLRQVRGRRRWKLQFSTRSYEGGEVVVPKFWILQNSPCNFWKLQFWPWPKTFKTLHFKPFWFKFLKLFYLIILIGQLI